MHTIMKTIRTGKILESVFDIENDEIDKDTNND